MKRKVLRRLLAGLAVLVLVFRMGFLLYFGDFYHKAERAFQVPGLDSDFIPQGIESFGDGFLISGYLSRSGRARLYHVDAMGNAGALRLLREDGSALSCHAGGVTAVGEFVYLVGGSQCYVFSAEEVSDWDRKSVTALGSFATQNRASFCCIWGDGLLVGEYAMGERYFTPESHHIVTASGEENAAMAMVFPLDDTAPLGVLEKPAAAVSMPERIQGLSLTNDGRIVLSASAALGVSQLYLYDAALVENGTLRRFHWPNGTSIPLYCFDGDARLETLYLPPQTEETTFRGGKLYVLFESASFRFQYGKLVGADSVYRMPLPEWNSPAK
ncbi:hypothetical protein [Oscillibacter sp.]|uniref:hypothetical protein n=1 Tax=Oscillibacter sp. TaxID=1945593 RepID=UPI002639340B|nr:hypothetical protein [Oscillibacter sp.]MDD3347312.1 hypothetical protein [Oscillibacter sp.]